MAELRPRPLSETQLEKTLLLACVAVFAGLVFALVWQRSQYNRFWKELDGYRRLHTEFSDWLDERGHPDRSPEPGAGGGEE